MSVRTAPRRRPPAPGLSDAERAIAGALLAVDMLRAAMAADAGILRAVLERQERAADSLRRIREDLACRLAAR